MMENKTHIQGEESTILLTTTQTRGIKKAKRRICWCVTLLLWTVTVSAVIAAAVTVSVVLNNRQKNVQPISEICGHNCTLNIVESIPENVTLDSNMSTYESWMLLLQSANTSIDIASFYWTLKGSDIDVNDTSDQQGQDIYNEIYNAHSRGIRIRVVQSTPTSVYKDIDSDILHKEGVIELRNLSMASFFNGGIVHTKLWIVDNKHFYIGSANMDFRSLTQVKELGLMGQNCSCLASDFSKIFDVYWMLSDNSVTATPKVWPESLYTNFNLSDPANLTVNNVMSTIYIASSPPEFNPPQRTNDIDALIDVINSAEKFIYIAVMDYIPAVIYTKNKKYWPVIDDALRTAAYERGVHVRLMGSYWEQTRVDMLKFLHSLGSLNITGPYNGSIETKCFVVPKLTDRSIPFTRVNHNKYMVTEKTAYIGTSNWSGDYFIDTAGVSCIIEQTNSTSVITIQKELKAIFERDWNSIYTTDCPLT